MLPPASRRGGHGADRHLRRATGEYRLVAVAGDAAGSDVVAEAAGERLAFRLAAPGRAHGDERGGRARRRGRARARPCRAPQPRSPASPRSPAAARSARSSAAAPCCSTRATTPLRVSVRAALAVLRCMPGRAPRRRARRHAGTRRRTARRACRARARCGGGGRPALCVRPADAVPVRRRARPAMRGRASADDSRSAGAPWSPTPCGPATPCWSRAASAAA